MTDIRIRPMTMSDADEAAAIEQVCFSSPWPASAFIKELEDNVCARYLVACDEHRIIGYGGMWVMVGHCHVTNLAVLPEYQRQGLGRRLMTALMKLANDEFEIRSMSLEVRRSNMAAQKLYGSMGFVVRDEISRYYEDNGEDALVMDCEDFTRWLT